MSVNSSATTKQSINVDLRTVKDQKRKLSSSAEKRMASVTDGAFHEYYVFQHPKESKMYVLKTGVEIQSPRLREEIVAVRKAMEKAFMLSPRKPSQVPPRTTVRIPDGASLEQLTATIHHTNKLRLDKDSGHVLPNHRLNGKRTSYQSGLTVPDLHAVLSVVKKIKGKEDFYIKLISGERTSHEFYRITSRHRVHLLHRGKLIGRGGGAGIYKTWDVMRNQIYANKLDTDAVTKQKVASRGSNVLREARILKMINPYGSVIGLQKPSRMVYQIEALDQNRGIQVQSGFITVLYDRDLADLLDKRSMETEQILHGANQLFQGVRALNQMEIPVVNLDIKSGNIFLKKIDDWFDMCVADFDQAYVIDENFFSSQIFRESPLPEHSSNSLTLVEGAWIQRVGEEIVAVQDEILELEVLVQRGTKKSKIHERLEELKNRQLPFLKEKYVEMARSAHVRAIAFVVYQMLLGVLVLNAEEVDLVMLIKHIRKDSSLSDNEKETRSQIASAIGKVLELIPAPPSTAITSKTPMPQVFQIEILISAVENIIRGR